MMKIGDKVRVVEDKEVGEGKGFTGCKGKIKKMYAPEECILPIWVKIEGFLDLVAFREDELEVINIWSVS